MRAIHFSGYVDPRGHPPGSENEEEEEEDGGAKTKNKRRAAAASAGDGIFATTFHMDRA